MGQALRRAFLRGKKGAIPNAIPPILERSKLNPKSFFVFVGKPSSHLADMKCQQHNKALGSVELKSLAMQLGQKFVCGLGDAKRLCVVAPW